MNLPRIDRGAVGAAAVTLLLTLVLGGRTFGLWLTAQVGYLVVPSAVGVPMPLPGLRATPLGGLGWAWTLGEDAAALALVGLVFWRLQARAKALSGKGAARTLLAGWLAFVIASTAVGAARGALMASFAFADPSGYLTYALVGAAFGLVWGLLLGWLPGMGALAARKLLRRPFATSATPSANAAATP